MGLSPVRFIPPFVSGPYTIRDADFDESFAYQPKVPGHFLVFRERSGTGQPEGSNAAARPGDGGRDVAAVVAIQARRSQRPTDDRRRLEMGGCGDAFWDDRATRGPSRASARSEGTRQIRGRWRPVRDGAPPRGGRGRRRLLSAR